MSVVQTQLARELGADLEEFERWMREWGYAESTIVKVMRYIRLVSREGLDSPFRKSREHRRYALRLYKRFLEALKEVGA